VREGGVVEALGGLLVAADLSTSTAWLVAALLTSVSLLQQEEEDIAVSNDSLDRKMAVATGSLFGYCFSCTNMRNVDVVGDMNLLI
jgi:hypothetical protein